MFLFKKFLTKMMETKYEKNPCPTKLEEERHRAKLTRKELSEITGVSIRTIEAYEQQKMI